MRIALINPPQPYLLEKQTQVPLGLLYLSAVLKRDHKDIEVDPLDFSAHSVEEVVQCLEIYDVYGFTATTLDYPSVMQITKKLKECHPRSAMIIGGPHASVASSEVLEDGFSHVFIGEAELTIKDFINDWSERKSKIIYRPSSLVDLESLPRPDRDSFPWLGGRVLVNKSNSSSINLMASRGCPYGCSFCASETIWKRKLRYRNVEDVVNEIKECIEKYGIRVFRFSDDNLTGNRRWMEKFCEKVTSLDVQWRLSIRVDSVSPDLFTRMRNAGCVEVGLGVESFDPRVLKVLKKKIEPEQSLQAVKMAHEAGLGARLLMMISTPGETYQSTVKRNIEALESLRGQFLYLSVKIFQPLPGSAIWKTPEKFGISIDSKDFNKYNFYAYRLNSLGRKERSLWSPISIKGMAKEQQEENIKQMLNYAENITEASDG